jgi:hypothetical protein
MDLSMPKRLKIVAFRHCNRYFHAVLALQARAQQEQSAPIFLIDNIHNLLSD